MLPKRIQPNGSSHCSGTTLSCSLQTRNGSTVRFLFLSATLSFACPHSRSPQCQMCGLGRWEVVASLYWTLVEQVWKAANGNRAPGTQHAVQKGRNPKMFLSHPVWLRTVWAPWINIYRYLVFGILDHGNFKKSCLWQRKQKTRLIDFALSLTVSEELNSQTVFYRFRISWNWGSRLSGP